MTAHFTKMLLFNSNNIIMLITFRGSFWYGLFQVIMIIHSVIFHDHWSKFHQLFQ